MEKNQTELKLPAGVSQDQMDVWKKQYGKLIVVSIEDEEGQENIVIFKRPTKDILAASTRKAKTDETEAVYFMYENCVLSADETVKKDDIMKLSAATQLGELLGGYKVKRMNY